MQWVIMQASVQTNFVNLEFGRPIASTIYVLGQNDIAIEFDLAALDLINSIYFWLHQLTKSSDHSITHEKMGFSH